MPKYVTSRRKIRKNNFFRLMFLMSLILWLGVTLFLRGYNANLSVAVQKINNETAQLRSDNELLTIEITKSASFNNVSKSAQSAGLNANQSNVVVIPER